MTMCDIKRNDIVIWKKPFTTLDYFLRETFLLTIQGIIWLRGHFLSAIIFLISVTLLIFYSNQIESPLINSFKTQVLWSLYWLGLGILSSVGLGTGLHTFILYLGPHIAKVTLAAYECGSLRFPEPPYPDEIVCPDIPDTRPVTLWDIMSKVRLEAFMWGAGTALGELPPYFMAKVKRLSGEEMIKESKKDKNVPAKTKTNNKKMNLLSKIMNEISDTFEKASSWVQFLVEKVGFFGILFCASFPNPVYDLAGITCGHFLVPFWTFFGATLIGKAVIKMHLQKLFVIIAFDENLLEHFIDKIKDLPILGDYLHKPFRDFLINQKERLHSKVVTKPHWIASLFEKLVVAMIIYFILSIINSLAQKYHSRITNTLTKSSDSSSLTTISSIKKVNQPNEENLLNKRTNKTKFQD
ncbi:vacuole membrane protein 1-like [Panonychus citri]|uniref:vacuole membrane protein 1-like n=1 Tax=Panonychus citri TaxID=50023 RepID=UPI00230747B6|nr:vacuole membrane protein 1-like [Panonychus citri]XP_053206760.1 vacuole membrane protein 1-like [Panonychus citri]XP_053206761.1 vacuole membrane protein 1-like [Panonychus citri]